MSTRLSLLAAVILVAASAVPAVRLSAQASSDAPNFTGTWDLDATKSNFGGLPTPTRWLMQVQHAGTSLQVVRETTAPMGDQRDSVVYVIGGPEVTYMANRGQTTGKATMEGRDLVIVSTLHSESGQDVPVISRWSLAPDGKVLTIARDVKVPGKPSQHVTIVFDKK